MSFIVDPLNSQFKGSPDQTELLNLFMVTTTEHMLDMCAGKPSQGALWRDEIKRRNVMWLSGERG